MPAATEKVYISFDEMFPVYSVSNAPFGFILEHAVELDSDTLEHIKKTIDEYNKVQERLESLWHSANKGANNA